MPTITAQITDAAIRRHAGDQDVEQIRDPRHPIRFRYLASRERGSWYLIQNRNGKTTREKIGGWPQLPAKKILDSLPDIIAARTVKPDAPAVVAEFDTLGELFTWYENRTSNARDLSDDRRANVSSAIKRHLIPLLGGLQLDQVTRAQVDERFYQVQQARYKPSTVQSQYKVAKAATAAALRLGKIQADPFLAIRWTCFSTARIPAKAGKLRPHQVADLFDAVNQAPINAAVLVAVMLAHGTRIGETRRAYWSQIEADAWFIPGANTKTGTDHLLPITEPVRQLLTAYRKHAPGAALFAASDKRHLDPSEASAQVRLVSKRNWTAHDLRKLARTRWMDQGTDYLVGEMLLNHALSRIDSAYIHTHAETQKRRALEIYHAWLMDNGLAQLIERLEGGA